MPDEQWELRPAAKRTVDFMINMETTIKVMQKDIDTVSQKLTENSTEHKDIMSCLKEISKKMSDDKETADTKYARREDLDFWRNVLVIGLIVSIALGVLTLLFKNL